jgi:hypothetical protein
MSDFTSVLLARTMVEAQIAEAALEEAHIACIVENFTSDPYDGLWVLQRGYGRVLVRREDEERARKVIAEALASAPLPGDEAPPAGEEAPEDTDAP